MASSKKERAMFDYGLREGWEESVLTYMKYIVQAQFAIVWKDFNILSFMFSQPLHKKSSVLSGNLETSLLCLS